MTGFQPFADTAVAGQVPACCWPGAHTSHGCLPVLTFTKSKWWQGPQYNPLRLRLQMTIGFSFPVPLRPLYDFLSLGPCRAGLVLLVMVPVRAEMMSLSLASSTSPSPH